MRAGSAQRCCNALAAAYADRYPRAPTWGCFVSWQLRVVSCLVQLAVVTMRASTVKMLATNFACSTHVRRPCERAHALVHAADTPARNAPVRGGAHQAHIVIVTLHPPAPSSRACVQAIARAPWTSLAGRRPAAGPRALAAACSAAACARQRGATRSEGCVPQLHSSQKCLAHGLHPTAAAAA
jgi:hypothetical protein